MSLYRRFHDRFGTAGVVIGVIAMIIALTGSAFAATGGLNGKQKKEVEKIAKKYAGKPGAPGAPGAPGTNGTNGKDGAEGKQGEKGDQGIQGIQGLQGIQGNPGTSVTSTESGSSFGAGHCDGTGNSGVGGSKFVAGASTTYACNGKEGSPWTAGGTLPSGKTETGAWTAGGTVAIGASQALHAVISFPIPLPAELDGASCNTVEPGPPPHVPATCHVHLILANGKELVINGATFTPEELEPVKCGSGIGVGVNVSNPQALPGHLCVYIDELSGASFGGLGGLNPIMKILAGTFPGASTAGAQLTFHSVTEKTGFGIGTFAVTAP